MVRVLILATLLALLGGAASARAQGLELRTDPNVEVPMTILLGATWFAAEGSKATLASSCRWCDGDALNPVDDAVRSALRWDDTESADRWSNIAAGTSGAAAIGEMLLVELADGGANRFPADELMVVEAVTAAGALNGVVKLGAARERPFVRALRPDEKRATKDPSDNDVSFYSGHASTTFAVAAASGTIASLRGYRYAPALWASGLTLAALTSYLRIGADRHYFTDVVVGAIAGTAIGVSVPLLLHGREQSSTATTAGRATTPLLVSFALPL